MVDLNRYIFINIHVTCGVLCILFIQCVKINF